VLRGASGMGGWPNGVDREVGLGCIFLRLY